MKVVLIIAVLLAAAASAAALAPAGEPYRLYLSAAALVLSLGVAVGLLALPSAKSPPPKPVAQAVRPPAPAAPANQAEAEIVSFLGLLQEKGRLIDFLMDDINPYTDAQVGAAARVVHAGCRSVLQEHFSISHVRAEEEGSKVEVPAGYPADEYRLTGRIAGQAPFTGTLVHRGWKTASVKLPRILRSDTARLPALAPAEVELK